MNLKSRLQKLEVKARGDVPPQVAEWIDSAMFFDELTESQKVIYCRYRWNTEEPPDKWFAGIIPGLEYTEHFLLDRRPPPPTPEELKKAEEEIDAYMKQRQKELAAEAAQDERSCL